jgi:SulP family sulfate permease
MSGKYRFNRLEIAGSLGDLGTLLPIAIGMIFINGLSPAGIFFSVGLFYIFSGVYYGVTVPVQPMKVVGAYAVATGMSAPSIMASALLLGGFLLVIGLTGAMDLIRRYTPHSVVRGVQLSTGTLLMVQGAKFILGTSTFQKMANLAEPHLSVQAIGPLPVGILIGVAAGILTLFLIENRRFPAGLIVVVGGIGIGLLAGTGDGFSNAGVGLFLPQVLPFGMPAGVDFAFVLVALVLPQIPMTLGNAVIANADLSREYFGGASEKVTPRALCVSMAFANIGAFFLGGMPLCHGAGGLAAHYRFGARTAGSNLFIGAVFLALALFLGPHGAAAVNLIPMAVLGVLLLFAGSQLAMTIMDLQSRKDLFVSLVMLGLTLATNLAVGFVVGIILAWALRWDRLNI